MLMSVLLPPSPLDLLLLCVNLPQGRTHGSGCRVVQFGRGLRQSGHLSAGSHANGARQSSSPHAVVHLLLHCLPLPVCHAAALHCELKKESTEVEISCLILFYFPLFQESFSWFSMGCIACIFLYIVFFQFGLGPLPFFIGAGESALLLSSPFLSLYISPFRTLRGGSPSRRHVPGQRRLLVVQPAYRHDLSHSPECLGCPRLPALLHQLPATLLAHQTLFAGDTRP